MLERIDSSTVLVNPLALVRWNASKTYLRDLESRGAAIVPSRWREHLERGSLAACFDELESERLILKPVISRRTQETRRFLLMELELIEPSMYLRMHPEAPARFAAALDAYVRSRM